MIKFRLRIFLLMFAGVAIAYTACKKSSVTKTDPTLTPDVIAGQVALNIEGSLFGGMGAFDASGGLDAPAGVNVHARNIVGGGLNMRPLAATQPKGKPMTTSLNNVTCGEVIDTTINVTGSSNGGTASISGHVKFNYTCSGSAVSGFTTDDNVTITLASPSLNLSYKVVENLTMLSLHPGNPDANLSLNGSLASNGSYQFNTGTKRSGTEVFNYTLSSLIISPTEGDVISGSATFNTSGSGPKGVWNYQGTITFLGNHMATVTINGKVYNVNTQTGKVN